jgi:predicted RNA methylase
MTCCSRYCAAELHFDRKVAERDLQRYRRRGPDAITRLMLAELQRWPLKGGRLLDVGSGVGVVSAELASAGVTSATLVEASPAYLEVAKNEVSPRYPSQPAQFVLADFASVARPCRMLLPKLSDAAKGGGSTNPPSSCDLLSSRPVVRTDGGCAGESGAADKG